MESLDVLLSPNPTEGMVQVAINNTKEAEMSILVMDANGRNLRWINHCSIQATSVDLRDLPSGLYCLKIQVGEQLIVKKVVKM